MEKDFTAEKKQCRVSERECFKARRTENILKWPPLIWIIREEEKLLSI